ncbi:phosphatidylinositol-specific phospholipase C/glycerophosphodiester phosphodiesterase family protein [soil metagenome]
MSCLIFSMMLITAAEPVKPQPQAHAHNDYEHKRPLLDALDQGFCSVEADIFLVEGELLVAHTLLDLKKDRTLQKLYLDPLRERVKANGGHVFQDGPLFHLMIDVKTDAKPTYAALAKVLADYADLLSEINYGKRTERAINVVISGNCDREAIATAKLRYCAIDGRPKDLDGTAPADLIPWISDSWKSHFKWDGTGTMPDAERTKMKALVAKAHEQKRLIRFWGTPDHAAVWEEQANAGVNLINTDKLAELKEYLTKRAKH